MSSKLFQCAMADNVSKIINNTWMNTKAKYLGGIFWQRVYGNVVLYIVCMDNVLDWGLLWYEIRMIHITFNTHFLVVLLGATKRNPVSSLMWWQQRPSVSQTDSKTLRKCFIKASRRKRRVRNHYSCCITNYHGTGNLKIY